MRFAGFEEMIGHFARGTPEAPAFLTEGPAGPCAVSYAAFAADIANKADILRRTGKTCCGVFCDGTYENAVTIFAAVKAGMQTVLLGDDADAAQITHTEIDLLQGDEELTEEFSAALTGGVTDGKDKILFFTSGTTAKNKAVVLTQQSLCASAYNGSALLPLQPEDRLMCMLPLAHVFGFVCGLLWGLSCGACVCLGRGPRHYADDLTYYRPTALSAVPMLLGFLVQRQLLNPELALVLIGAGDCPAALPAALRRMGKRVSFGYGLTETSSGVALSLGEDPYAMTVCPDDRVFLAPDGEILIENTTCMMQGYYKDPAATKAVLRNGILSTGDLGRFDEKGLLHVTGRKKEIVVLSDGTKLFLPEYEQALQSALPGRDFAVIAPDGIPALIVKGGENDADAIRAAIEPYMKTQPLGSRIRTIRMTADPLPRTATGKIKRWELQQKASNI